MRAKLLFILVMLIFGSIGLFVKNINLASSEIAFFRGAIGSVFIIIASFIVKQKLNFRTSKRNIVLLIISGCAMGFNWIFLFEAYRYTTISNATLSYYFAPLFVMVLAPFLLKEKWTWKKGISISLALLGLFLVVNPGGEAITGSYNHLGGIGYGLLAALLYASVILINKFIKNLSDIETTVMQLGVATIVLFPYVMLTVGLNVSTLEANSLILLAIVGIIHTGVAYLLYFSVLKRLKSDSIAVLSYIDPISAVLLAAIILNETMTLIQTIGGVLILSSTFINDWKPLAKRKIKVS